MLTATNVVEAVKANGGVSLNIDGAAPTSGFMVSLGAKWSYVASADVLDDIASAVNVVGGFLNRHKVELSAKTNYLGAWLYEGQVYLDVSECVSDIDDAVNAGIERNQIAVWDVVAGAEIATGGNGEV